MFDIGFTELLVIGVVALIVVGPKDLPGMFRTLGRFTARARQMGREFSQAMNDAADESGAKDIAETLKTATSPKAMGLDKLNKAADGFEKWDPAKSLRDQKAADSAAKTPSDAKAQGRGAAARKAKDSSAKSTEVVTPDAVAAPKVKPTSQTAAKKSAKTPQAKTPKAKSTDSSDA